MSTLITNTQADDALRNIKKLLDNQEDIIPVNAYFQLTKGKPGHASAHIFRDKSLEEDVFSWIEMRIGFDQIMGRYKNYYPSLESLERPKHYATRFINVSGLTAIEENIFMFFPEAIGIHSGKEEDYFGFEFIDAWLAVFEEIVFPCMRKIFDEETQLKLFVTLRPMLEKTIYLSSVFHEIGHRCGYWKVSPTKDENITIKKFHTDVLGELATDTLLVNFLAEFPEVLYFVFLQRLFWFGRFGFKNNPLSGKINEDNDAWIGSYLWNRYIESNAITQNNDHSWHVNFENLKNAFSKVQNEIDHLAVETIKNRYSQDNSIHEWMKSTVSYEQDNFIIPEKMQRVFIRCLDIPEKPSIKYY